MLKMKINGLNNTNCMFDLQRTIMLTAIDAVWLIDACLLKTGSSGCLAREAARRTRG